MRFAFQNMRLEADSLYALVANPVEMQLQVTDGEAVIVGYGYPREIAGAFTELVLDWEATILPNEDEFDLEPGEYDLLMVNEELFACKDQEKQAIPDMAVVVEVVRGEEQE